MIYFDNAFEISPDNFITWYNKGSALAELGMFDEALNCINETLNLNPEMEEAIELKPMILEKINNPKK